MKLLRITVWIVALFWFVSALFFIPFTEMSGEGKRFLMGMATVSFFGLVIFELVKDRTTLPVTLESPERSAVNDPDTVPTPDA
jgi:hypothetical protein